LIQEEDRFDEAEPPFRQALKIQHELAKTYPTRSDYRDTLAACHINLGGLLQKTKRFQEAEDAYRAAVELRQKLIEEAPHWPRNWHGLGTALG
jgi:tetratricopeptide (TPR) repeat protein